MSYLSLLCALIAVGDVHTLWWNSSSLYMGKNWQRMGLNYYTYMLQFPGLLPCKLIIFLTVDWVGLLVYNYA